MHRAGTDLQGSGLTVDAKMHQADFVNETFSEFLKTLTGDASYRAIAEQAGLEPSTLTRQMKGELKVQTVVAICRAYRGNLLHAFVAAGYITQQEAESLAAVAGVSKATDTELAEEILRRVRNAEAHHPVLTSPITGGDPVGGAQEDLTEMDDLDLKSRFDLAANNDQSAERLDQENS